MKVLKLSTTKISNDEISITTPAGVSMFIDDLNKLIPDVEATIIGIEDAQIFINVTRYRHRFPGGENLFVLRHCSERKIVDWLETLPNKYLHFGDFDFKSFSNYGVHYKQRLGARCSYLLLPNFEKELRLHGNEKIFNDQLGYRARAETIAEESICKMIDLMTTYKRGLKQSSFI